MPVSFTPTPTPSNSPTVSLTPSISPSITPSLTSCADSCCFPNNTGSFSGGPGSIQFVKYNPDYSFFMFGNALTNLNGTILTASNRISNCGSVLNAYAFGNVFFGGVDYGGVATQSTGKILVIEEKSCRRLNANYSIDTTGFTAGYASPADNSRYTTGIAIGENDKYFICGVLTGWTYYTGGTVVSSNTNIIRFNPDGIVDTTYSGNSLGVSSGGLIDDPYMFNDYNGKIMITSITSWNGDTTRKGLIRLNADGTLDTSFTSSAFSGVAGTSVITAIALPNGKYLVGGSFTNLLGISTQDYLVRLNADGTLDTTFVNGGAAYLSVKDIDIQSTGKIIVFGRQTVFRLNANGTLDTSFTIGVLNAATSVGSLSVSPSDTIVVGSNFSTYNGQPFLDLVKLDEDGNLNMCPFPSATPTNTPTPSITPTRATPTPTPTFTSTPTETPVFVYIYAGTVSQYGSDTLACANKTCGRPYYKSIPSWSLGSTVYEDNTLTTVYNGNNLWIAVDTATGSYCSGTGWAAVQINPGGIITNFISCP